MGVSFKQSRCQLQSESPWGLQRAGFGRLANVQHSCNSRTHCEKNKLSRQICPPNACKLKHNEVDKMQQHLQSRGALRGEQVSLLGLPQSIPMALCPMAFDGLESGVWHWLSPRTGATASKIP
eukprot:1690502-Amphidinium_carterae.2